MKELLIGIDFSKKKFDASLIERAQTEKVNHREFANTKEGCLELLHWVTQKSRISKEAWLFCGEHTGLYSVLLSSFLIKKRVLCLDGEFFANQTVHRPKTE
jgi:transposase